MMSGTTDEDFDILTKAFLQPMQPGLKVVVRRDECGDLFAFQSFESSFNKVVNAHVSLRTAIVVMR